jgi:thioredoxin reductase
VFHEREPLRCSALFFCSDCEQRSSLPENLGCAFDAEGNVLCNGHAATNVPGLYVAGNVRGGVHLAIVAAAEGAEAGIAINRALLEADFR